MTVTLSMEVELAWGAHDTSDPDSFISANREQETKFLEKLLRLCDDLDIPFSFDIVGHLFIDECDGHHDGGHQNGWFDSDPGSSRERDPTFYAPDLVDMILNTNVEHEICTHTFSHVLCDEVSEEVLDWELETVADLHEKVCGKKPLSFVPPRHRAVDNDQLRNHGIRTVRKPLGGYNPPRNKIEQYLRSLFRSHPVSNPEIVDDVLETYCTPYPSLTAPYLPSGGRNVHPAYRLIPVSVRQRLHKKYLVDGLERSHKTGADIHYWTHLYNMADTDQMETVEFLLRRLSEEQGSNRMNIKTMEELSRSVDI